jgi:hypothetical protein
MDSDKKFTLKLNPGLPWHKQHSTGRSLFFISNLDLNLRKKLMKFYSSSAALYDAETWSLRKVDHKHLESSDLWCWRRMVKISWFDRVRNEEVLHRVKEDRNIIPTVTYSKM